jgi:hypothetical protein
MKRSTWKEREWVKVLRELCTEHSLLVPETFVPQAIPQICKLNKEQLAKEGKDPSVVGKGAMHHDLNSTLIAYYGERLAVEEDGENGEPVVTPFEVNYKAITNTLQDEGVIDAVPIQYKDKKGKDAWLILFYNSGEATSANNRAKSQAVLKGMDSIPEGGWLRLSPFPFFALVKCIVGAIRFIYRAYKCSAYSLGDPFGVW